MKALFSQWTPRLACLAALAFSGCVSSRYKLAKADTPPARPLNLAATQPPVEAMLHTVIIFQGPGAWKREAYWDEYVLMIANRGTAPLIVDSASLRGLAEHPAAPGTNPWALEKQSRTEAEQNFGLAKNAVTQLGGGVGALTVGAGTGALIGGSGWAALGGAFAGTLIAVPAFVGVSVYANISSRHEIEREFTRRRLELPLILPAGGTAQGSLFFPITPGPRELSLQAHADGAPREVVIDLTPLRDLHLKTPAAATKVADSAGP